MTSGARPLWTGGPTALPLGVGAWAWGDTRYWGYGRDYDADDVEQAYLASRAAGLSVVDTAEVYGRGVSERLVGRLVRADPQAADVAVATKFGAFPWRAGRRGPLRHALESSLGRLRTDRVALYQIHFSLGPLSDRAWLADLAEAYHEGLIGAVGVSNYGPAKMRAAHTVLADAGVPLATNQVQYSLLERKPETSGLVEACRELGVTIIAYSPLAQGLLSGKYTAQHPPPGYAGSASDALPTGSPASSTGSPRSARATTRHPPRSRWPGWWPRGPCPSPGRRTPTRPPPTPVGSAGSCPRTRSPRWTVPADCPADAPARTSRSMRVPGSAICCVAADNGRARAVSLRLAGVRRGPLEKDTCRDVVLPALARAGWAEEQIRPEFPVTAGRVMSSGGVERDLGDGRVDYVLEIVPGLPVAVVEAKRAYRAASDGLQQAVRYAEQLDMPVAYATNGREIIERDLLAGTERLVDSYMTPPEIWDRYAVAHGLDEGGRSLLRQGFNRQRRTASGDVVSPRWYQSVAIHRVLAAMARGERRVLLLMATGTGKTFTAMQIVHKLRAYVRLTEPDRNYRVLYLADRDALIEQPKRKDFSVAFGGDPLWRVAGEANRSREIYFATYQALAGHGDESELFRDYPPDFFDLVVVDECHRGSAAENSSWRAILEHFDDAVQIGLTATPKQGRHG